MLHVEPLLIRRGRIARLHAEHGAVRGVEVELLLISCIFLQTML